MIAPVNIAMPKDLIGFFTTNLVKFFCTLQIYQEHHQMIEPYMRLLYL